MSILSNIGKSSVLAACTFWIINLSHDFDWNYIPFIFLSLIPIYFCCAIVILFTIYPIFWFLVREDFNKQQIFKLYFPVYAILMFIFCCFCIYKTQTNTLALSFFISAFITTLNSWVLLAKPKKAKQIDEIAHST